MSATPLPYDRLLLPSRNDSLGFALRTRRNLEYVLAAPDLGEVHVVTQLVNSLLGLVIFPWQATLDTRIASLSLEELADDEWPQWKFEISYPYSLGDLIQCLRRAAAHRNVHFSTDARELKDVVVTFWNKPNDTSKTVLWKGEIRADALLAFCLRFTQLAQQQLS
jgi:hypothetical protein